MSDEQQEQHEKKKPAESPAEDDSSRSSKSYSELLKGFAEIGRLQHNQEEFNRRGKTGSSLEKKAKKGEANEPSD